MSSARETYWRVFSTELNASTYEIKTDEEMKPSYQLSPLGIKINKILVVGVLTEKENVGDDDEPMWRGRIEDIAKERIYINIGRFQVDAANDIRDIDTPSMVAVLGKVKSYTNEEGRTFISVRPERIMKIDAEIQNQWILDTAKTTWQRLLAMKKALKYGDADAETLKSKGFSEEQARNIAMALEMYGQPDSAKYLRSLQSALRTLLPEREIDFGLPEDNPESPDEYYDMDESSLDNAPAAGSFGKDEAPAQASQEPAGNNEDRESVVLNLLQELNDGKGAPRDLLEDRCNEMGISSMDLEEIIEGLLDKGLAYEPNLKYIKRIDD